MPQGAEKPLETHREILVALLSSAAGTTGDGILGPVLCHPLLAGTPRTHPSSCSQGQSVQSREEQAHREGGVLICTQG